MPNDLIRLITKRTHTHTHTHALTHSHTLTQSHTHTCIFCHQAAALFPLHINRTRRRGKHKAGQPPPLRAKPGAAGSDGTSGHGQAVRAMEIILV